MKIRKFTSQEKLGASFSGDGGGFLLDEASAASHDLSFFPNTFFLTEVQPIKFVESRNSVLYMFIITYFALNELQI